MGFFMALTKEEKKERARKKRDEWNNELARLYQRQAQRKIDPAQEMVSRRNSELLDRIHAEIQGSAFKAWYEATTGTDVSVFVDKVVISQEEFLERFNGKIGSQLDWTREAIERVVESNPWTNPETKAYWAEEIANTTDSSRRREIMIRLGTPRWASRKKVLEIYRECERITAETGVRHHVDHIVPVVHPDVCGLHCEFNLRIIPAEENQSKSNSFNGVSRRIRKAY